MTNLASSDSSLFALHGAVALVTGAGSGIGRAVALALARSGARVAATELPGRGSLTASLAADLGAQGSEAMELTLDVRNTLTIESTIRQVVKRFGRLDILINNAGTQLLKAALELEESEYDQVLNVNLKGPFFCSQAAAAFMREQGGGCIVNVASQHGVVGNRMRAAYCASKGGLINLTRALAIEWAEYNIRVNCVSPTFVANEGNQALLAQEDLQAEIAKIPLGRVATPQDVAAGVCYLVSPAARMVTGHNLLIDGGWTAQ